MANHSHRQRDATRVATGGINTQAQLQKHLYHCKINVPRYRCFGYVYITAMVTQQWDGRTEVDYVMTYLKTEARLGLFVFTVCIHAILKETEITAYQNSPFLYELTGNNLRRWKTCHACHHPLHKSGNSEKCHTPSISQVALSPVMAAIKEFPFKGWVLKEGATAKRGKLVVRVIATLCLVCCCSVSCVCNSVYFLVNVCCIPVTLCIIAGCIMWDTKACLWD